MRFDNYAKDERFCIRHEKRPGGDASFLFGALERGEALPGVRFTPRRVRPHHAPRVACALPARAAA